MLSSALGEGAFQLRKIGKGFEGGAKKRYEEKGPFDPRKPLDWLLYQGARFINHNLNGLGILLDIVGAPFRKQERQKYQQTHSKRKHLLLRHFLEPVKVEHLL